VGVVVVAVGGGEDTDIDTGELTLLAATVRFVARLWTGPADVAAVAHPETRVARPTEAAASRTVRAANRPGIVLLAGQGGAC
jgi:hypothetical protein